MDLVSSGVREVREHSIVDNDGIEREIDTLIFATGFTPAELPIAQRIRGRDGRSLAEVWAGSPQAYLGTTVSGFPNLFFLYGPNLNLGHSSIVYMLESQLELRAGRAAHRCGCAARPSSRCTPRSQAAYNEEIQERLARTVWNNGGCGSWYFDSNGRNSIHVARLHLRIPAPHAPLRRAGVPPSPGHYPERWKWCIPQPSTRSRQVARPTRH